MKVFLRVLLDVSASESGREFDPEQVREAAHEAVHDVLSDNDRLNADHAMRGRVDLLFDYAEVIDSDLDDEF